ncbi:hypothetical protein CPB84DRAFT_1827044 [Gymnopilus junonius]|uniref:Uncharacterized protein n=1 Tax=Gymnopilus junonius TaxID=109634 RepID=A0A9P5TJ09_GYMJU|nr:hypothetical protein CPB84DRAFT_1827044 [Gymnopilus junonius]
MLSNKLVLFFVLFVTLIAACPISERATSELEARSPFWNGKINPNMHFCKKVTDCKCPKKSNKQIHSTSCINGVCKCDDAAVNFFAGKWMQAIVAIGNAPITRAVGQLMKGLADVKQVIGTIVGAFLPPPAKLALKAALQAFPSTGPSHIDDATKKALVHGF